jgi:hypothetical protein
MHRHIDVDGDDPEQDVDGEGEAVELLDPGVNVIKLLLSIITDFHNKLECLSLAIIADLV